MKHVWLNKMLFSCIVFFSFKGAYVFFYLTILNFIYDLSNGLPKMVPLDKSLTNFKTVISKTLRLLKEKKYLYMNISFNIIDILCLYILFWIRRIPVLLLSYSGEIDLCIVHSCMYPSYFLSDFGQSSGQNLLQKWCKFCFSILLLCKGVFTVEDYFLRFKIEWMGVILTECSLSLHEITSVFQRAVIL